MYIMIHYGQLGLDTAGELGWRVLWSTTQNCLTKHNLSACAFLVKGYRSSKVLPEPPASANQALVAKILQPSGRVANACSKNI